MKNLLYKVYGVYAGLVFLILVTFIGLPFVMLWPRKEGRLRWLYFWAQILFFLIGIRIKVEGRENLPKETSIIAFNHVSNVDGPLLKALLPSRFSFVAKRELGDIPVIGLALKRIGCVFVRRGDPTQGRRDSNYIIHTLRAGESLIIFPEGTFSYSPGIMQFKKGGFIAAVRTGAPVVPGLIIGARKICPPDAVMIRPGKLTVKIFPPVYPNNERHNAVGELLNAARKTMIEHYPECQPLNIYDCDTPPKK